MLRRWSWTTLALLPGLLAAPPAFAGDAAAPGDAARDAGAAPGPTRTQIARTWGALRVPTTAPALSIGGYANGCIDGAVALPVDGPNYQVMRLSRRRNFGHPALADYVRRLALEMKRRRLGPLVVGDLGQPRGGPTLSGHRSHQTGLDVDLWYVPPAAAAKRRLTPRERETASARAVVDLDRRVLTGAWNPRLATLIEVAVSDPVVDRIFVHPVIKKTLCAQAGKNRGWLTRVRPWWGHHDHLHVRLSCPAESPACEPIEPLSPDDDGCGASLEWWLTEEPRLAQEKREREKQREKKPPEPEPPAPPLPAGCAAVLEPSVVSASPTSGASRATPR